MVWNLCFKFFLLFREVLKIKCDIIEEILSVVYVLDNLKYYDSVMREIYSMYGRECFLDFIKKK